MSQSTTEPEKQKRSQLRHRGCFVLLLIPILLAVTCYGGMWAFARYSGEWLARRSLPIPPESHLMERSEYKEYSYTCELSIYSDEMSPEALREWFIENHITVSPVLSKYTDDLDYYDDSLDRYSSKRDDLMLLRYMSLNITSDHDEEYYTPHKLKIYKSKQIFLGYYPNIALPDGMTAFEVALCWYVFQ